MSTLLLTSLFIAETIAPTLESFILVTLTSQYLVFVICKGLHLSFTSIISKSGTIASVRFDVPLSCVSVNLAQAAVCRFIVTAKNLPEVLPSVLNAGFTPERVATFVRLNHEYFPSFIAPLLSQSPHFTQDLSSFVCQDGVQLK